MKADEIINSPKSYINDRVEQKHDTLLMMKRNFRIYNSDMHNLVY